MEDARLDLVGGWGCVGVLRAYTSFLEFVAHYLGFYGSVDIVISIFDEGCG